MKKDPLLMAILYENIITLTSTSVPILTSLFTSLGGGSMIILSGNMFMGGIQLYLGYFILKENIPKLLGEGVDAEVLN